MIQRTLCLVLLWLALPWLSRAQDLPEAGAVIDRVVEAYGGAEALAAMHSYRMVGELRAVGRPQPVEIVRLFVHPGRLRVEIAYPDSPEIRLLDGDRGWRIRNMEAQPVSGMLLSAMLLQAARSDLPSVLDDHRDSVRVVGPVLRDERSLVGLEIALAPTLLFRAYVDPETHHVVESLGILLADGQTVQFVTEYADFRTVEGLVFPFAEENYASGVHTGSTRLNSVELNPPVTREDFRPSQ